MVKVKRRSGETEEAFQRRKALAAEAEPAEEGARRKDVVFKEGRFAVSGEGRTPAFEQQQLEREQQNIEAQALEERKLREQSELVTGGLDPLIGRLEEKQKVIPSLAPELGAGETLAKAGLDALAKVGGLLGQDTTVDTTEFAKTKTGKIIGGSAIAAIGLGVGVALTSLATFAIGSIGKGGSGGLGVATAAIATGFGISKATDIKGGQIDNLEKELSDIESRASSIQSGATAGADPQFSFDILLQMETEVLFTEQKIQELGLNNIEFRSEERYVQLQAKIATTRANLLERARVVRLVATTGSPTASPESLIAWFESLPQEQVNEIMRDNR